MGTDINGWIECRRKLIDPDYYSHTWISWQELKTSEWKTDQYWQLMVKVLEILAGLYGEENVRLVVWFAD